jgi:histone-lysine N-methyltransferase SETMAR
LDEAWMYVTNCNGKNAICYVRRGQKTPEDWVKQCSESFPKGFMVVGATSGRGVLPLIKVPPKAKINAEYYIDYVLKPIIEEHLPRLYPQDMDKVFLHHDKASSHTARKTMAYLEEISSKLGITFIKNSDIPVKSPDASPMDFFAFGYLKQRLLKRRASTRDGLWKVLREEWSTISLEQVKRVFDSWKVRCRLIAKRGGKQNSSKEYIDAF